MALDGKSRQPGSVTGDHQSSIERHALVIVENDLSRHRPFLLLPAAATTAIAFLPDCVELVRK